jgi:hypothetical protein
MERPTSPTWSEYEARDKNLQSVLTDDNICLENDTFKLHDQVHHSILVVGNPRWFEDDIIDVGLDFLERILSCELHAIALANTTWAKSLYNIGADASNRDTGVASFDKRALTKFTDKDFIVVPINNGYAVEGDQSKKRITDGDDVHCSVMVVDCRLEKLDRYYYDSWHPVFDEEEPNHVVAWNVLFGLQALLNASDASPGQYQGVEVLSGPNVPLQSRHNASAGPDGGSACGPFVWVNGEGGGAVYC